MPVEKNITHYRGDDWDFPMRLRGRAPDGTLLDYIDLTGYVPKAELRAAKNDVAVAAEITCTLADQVASKGGITLSLSHVQTAALDGDYFWDWQMTDPGGKVKTYFTGVFTVSEDVTRA